MHHYIHQIEKSHVRTKNSVKATQFPFGHMGTKVYHILWPFKIVLCHVLANSFPQQTPTNTIISLESCSWPHNGCKSNIHSSFFCVHHLLRELSRSYAISRNAQQHLPQNHLHTVAPFAKLVSTGLHRSKRLCSLTIWFPAVFRLELSQAARGDNLSDTVAM